MLIEVRERELKYQRCNLFMVVSEEIEVETDSEKQAYGERVSSALA